MTACCISACCGDDVTATLHGWVLVVTCCEQATTGCATVVRYMLNSVCEALFDSTTMYSSMYSTQKSHYCHYSVWSQQICTCPRAAYHDVIHVRHAHACCAYTLRHRTRAGVAAAAATHVRCSMSAHSVIHNVRMSDGCCSSCWCFVLYVREPKLARRRL